MSEIERPATRPEPAVVGERSGTRAAPKLLGFVCEWSLGRTDLIEEDGTVVGLPNIRTLKVPCSGFVKPEWIQLGFENGAQGVFVLGCPLGDCHFNEGNYIISDRIVQLQKRLLGRKTIDDEGRIAELYLGATEGGDFTGQLRDFSDYVAGLPELAPPVKKGRGAGAAKPAAGAADAKPAAAPTLSETLAEKRVGPSPARTANTDAALTAGVHDTDTSGSTSTPASSRGIGAPATSGPAASAAPTFTPPSPAMAVPPTTAPAPASATDAVPSSSAPAAAPAPTPSPAVAPSPASATPSASAEPATIVVAPATPPTPETGAPAEGERPKKVHKRWVPKDKEGS